AFQHEQSAQAASLEQRQAEAQAARRFAAPLEPVLTPAEQASQVVANVLLAEVRGDDGRDSDGDGLSDLQEQNLGTSAANPTEGPQRLATLTSQALAVVATGSSPALAAENGVDSDFDGLTDYQEQFLGTGTLNADTDNDGLNDGLEASGFDFAGRRWYTNPLAIDTNYDGVIDLLEVNQSGNALQPRDSDGDGSLDVFDRDNDNDGVPDSVDISSLQHSGSQGAFNGDRPLWLKLDSLNPGKLTAVDIQVRPQTARQLWYAQSRFDWPADNGGQIQDRDNSTDDIQILPMLEITIPSDSLGTLPAYTTLRDGSGNPTGQLTSPELQAQGVTIRQADTSSVVAYVPLSIVTDQQTGERVAMSGRMLYRGTPGWGGAHRVRLVWAVQMRNDDPNGQNNVASVVQTYTGEAWTLTGLQVREDHGVNGALVYADPAVQSDPVARDDALFALINGLDRTFMRGRSDLTPAELSRRFNRTTNGGVSDAQRWNVPNIMRAESYTYGDQIAMFRDIAGNRNQAILQSIQAQHQPILLNLRNESYRGLNLNALGSNAGWSGSLLTMHLYNGGENAVTVQTDANLSIHGFQFVNSAWTQMSREQVVQAFVQRYQSRLSGDEALQAGQMALLRNYVAVLLQGVNATIAENDRRLIAAVDNDAVVAQINAALAQGPAGGMKHALEALGVGIGTDNIQTLTQMGKLLLTLGKAAGTAAGGAYSIASKILTGTKAQIGFAIRGALIGALAAGFIIAAANMFGDISPELRHWLDNGGMEVVQQVAVSFVSAVKFGADLIRMAKFGVDQLKGWGAAATVVLGLVTAGATIALAIVEIVANKLTGVALAQVIITTVLQVAWIVFLTVLAFVPKVGPIIVAIIGLIDAVLSIFLSIILGKATTFSSWFFQQIARFIVDEARYYTVNPAVASTNFGLLNRDMGMVAANGFRFNATVNSNLAWNPHMIGNRWFGNPWSTGTAYGRLSGAVELAGGEQNLYVVPGWPYIQGSYQRSVDFRFNPGINRSTALWLNTAFNLPLKRCILLWCGSYDDTQRYNMKLSDAITFDVFPNSLNEFMDIAPRDGGFRLAWDPHFPRLADADFDGVPFGSDPNDNNWDSDGDGLADAFEIRQASYGLRFNPASADSDGDGLGDRDESIYSTNPTQYDTDKDGLSDLEEVNGFAGTFGGRSTLVRTSPLAFDSDGDGASDYTEIRQGGSIAQRSRLGYWRLNDGQGFAPYANSAGGLPLYCITAAACATPAGTVDGRAGARFDGGDDQITATADERYRMTNEFSFAAWIYPTGNSNGILVNREGEYEIARFPDGTIQWAFANANPGWTWISTGAVAPLNRWTHVAVTYLNGIVITYLNGNQVHTYNGTGMIADVHPGWEELRFGGRSITYQPYTGLMSEIQLFNRALPAAEIGAVAGLQSLSADATVTADPVVEAATPAVGVFAAVDDPDLTVRPGQTVAYAVTLSHTLPESRPLRGQVWLNLPGGGSPSFPFELLYGEERTYTSTITIPADAAEGSFTIDTIAQYNLGGAQTARWDQPNFVSRPGSDLSAVALAAAPGGTAPYALAAVAGTQVQFFAARPANLDAPINLAVGSRPAIACLTGACLVAWQTADGISVARVANGAASRPITLGSGVAPVVASDGSGFLVAWIAEGVLRAQRIDGSGAISGDPLTLDANAGAGTAVALTRAGSVYLAVYERGTANARDIWAVRIGTTSAGAPVALTQSSADERAPALAYSAGLGRTLAVYLRDGTLFGQIIGANNELSLLSDGIADLTTTAIAPPPITSRSRPAPGSITARRSCITRLMPPALCLAISSASPGIRTPPHLLLHWPVQPAPHVWRHRPALPAALLRLAR
ncbi:MAG: hypothetical protein HC822_06140, partial [Oscillochloris sp.]|nr:hypothetical protein [Oscillochloris sp.]